MLQKLVDYFVNLCLENLIRHEKLQDHSFKQVGGAETPNLLDVWDVHRVFNELQGFQFLLKAELVLLISL
jgi:hypothetical protein